MARDKRRSVLLEKFGPLYKKYPTEGKWCIYCGEREGLTRDHVPALDAVDDMGSAYFERNGHAFWIVPCCFECNSALGNREGLFTITTRKQFLAGWIYKRYEKAITKGSPWTDEELAEFGYNLRGLLKQLGSVHEWATRRWHWARGF